MNKIMVLAVSAAFAFVSAAESPKSLKVLTIGNSFSIQMSYTMPPIAKDMGLGLDIVSLYIGGCSIERHVKNIEKPEENPYKMTCSYASADKEKAIAASVSDGKGGYLSNIPVMLKADKWDVVTIQQASHFSWQSDSYHPWGDKLVATIRELAPQAKIVVHETWSYTPWDKRFAKWTKEKGETIDQNVMYERLHKAYGDFAAKYGFEVIPTGTAVQRFRKELPVVYTENSFGGDPCGSAKFVQEDGKWIPKGDVFHMNASGNYLQALVWTAKLFGADVTKCNYVIPALKNDAKCAELMKRIAVEVVK